jgi:hypothetical protein
LQSWFSGWAANRTSDHVEHLWRLAVQAQHTSIDQVDETLFNRCADLPIVGFHKLTIGLFWINPTHFLPADKKTIACGVSHAAQAPEDYRTYKEWIQRMSTALGTNYPQVSHAAHLAATEADIEPFTSSSGTWGTQLPSAKPAFE